MTDTDLPAGDKTMDSQVPKPIGELFSQVWTQYKERALPLLAVILISTVMISSLILVTFLLGAFGATIFIHFMENMVGLAIVVLLITFFILLITILAIWCQTAMLAIIVDENLGIIEAFQRGWKYLWPMSWLITILSGILITGFTLGILPGFLFLVWFSFCVFIMFEEDQRGLDTLLLSREYVRGYGWNTFGKMGIIWLASLFASIIPLLGQILSILIAPFCMLFLLAMYRDLKSIKGTVELEDGLCSRILWWTVTITGFILPIVALLALMYALLNGEQNLIIPSWQGTHETIL